MTNSNPIRDDHGCRVCLQGDGMRQSRTLFGFAGFDDIDLLVPLAIVLSAFE
ncbi:MAG: hypothetical protein AAGD07_26355 [Planctomycetota bacterium]